MIASACISSTEAALLDMSVRRDGCSEYGNMRIEVVSQCTFLVPFAFINPVALQFADDARRRP
jgi:hypothetical protein